MVRRSPCRTGLARRPVEQLGELRPAVGVAVVAAELGDGLVGELDERVAVVLVEGGADDRDVAHQARLEEVEHPGQQLAPGQVAGGTEQDDGRGRERHGTSLHSARAKEKRRTPRRTLSAAAVRSGRPRRSPASAELLGLISEPIPDLSSPRAASAASGCARPRRRRPRRPDPRLVGGVGQAGERERRGAGERGEHLPDVGQLGVDAVAALRGGGELALGVARGSARPWPWPR